MGFELAFEVRQRQESSGFTKWQLLPVSSEKPTTRTRTSRNHERSSVHSSERALRHVLTLHIYMKHPIMSRISLPHLAEGWWYDDKEASYDMCVGGCVCVVSMPGNTYPTVQSSAEHLSLFLIFRGRPLRSGELFCFGRHLQAMWRLPPWDNFTCTWVKLRLPLAI